MGEWGGEYFISRSGKHGEFVCYGQEKSEIFCFQANIKCFLMYTATSWLFWHILSKSDTYKFVYVIQLGAS